MAPEVALRRPYNEKVDVYSFGIMVWQMARDRVPYKNFNKADFMERVALNGERPKPDKSWPPAFTSLLESCWHADPSKRPSFERILQELDNLIEPPPSKGWPSLGKGATPAKQSKTTDSKNESSTAAEQDSSVVHPEGKSNRNSQSSWF